MFAPDGLISSAAPPTIRSDDSVVARSRAIEWPTLALAIGIYAGWGLLTFFHARLGHWVFAPACAWIVAWQGSLQHEILHGHPTRSRRFNVCLGSIPLSLWLPFERYRSTHLSHHNDERLTDPLDDPESYYWRKADWLATHPLNRLLVRAQTTFLGRLTIGPAWNICRFMTTEWSGVRAGHGGVRRAWMHHFFALAPLIAWLTLVCHIDLAFYMLAVVYPATALLIVRSFAEHKAAHGVFERTAVVENAGLFGFLFLHNNLHAAHHERPTLPWYKLPDWYRANRDGLLAKNNNLLYQGYSDVARRFLLKAHDRPDHPFAG